MHLWSGATALGAAFANFGQDLMLPENIGREANLLLIGLILGGIFVRFGHAVAQTRACMADGFLAC